MHSNLKSLLEYLQINPKGGNDQVRLNKTLDEDYAGEEFHYKSLEIRDQLDI